MFISSGYDSTTTTTSNIVVGLLQPSSALTQILNNIIEGNLENLETTDQMLNAILEAIGYIAPTPSNVTQIIDAAANAASAQPNSVLPNLLVYSVNLFIQGINPKAIQTST